MASPSGSSGPGAGSKHLFLAPGNPPPLPKGGPISGEGTKFSIGEKRASVDQKESEPEEYEAIFPPSSPHFIALPVSCVVYFRASGGGSAAPGLLAGERGRKKTGREPREEGSSSARYLAAFLTRRAATSKEKRKPGRERDELVYYN